MHVFDKIIYIIHIFSYVKPPLAKDFEYTSEVDQCLPFADCCLICTAQVTCTVLYSHFCMSL